MLCPTIKNISEIIEKLKELQITIANIEDMPLEFPEYKTTDDKSLSVEQLISLAAGHGHGLSDDKIVKMFESSPETLDLLFAPSRKVVEKLPTLPMDTLKKLLKDEYPDSSVTILYQRSRSKFCTMRVSLLRKDKACTLFKRPLNDRLRKTSKRQKYRDGKSTSDR